MIDKNAAGELEAAVGREFYSDRTEDLILYESDGTNQPGFKPDAVIRPGSTEEVSEIIKIAGRYGIPVVPRGAGSGLTGGALPVRGGIIMVMNRMSRIIEIDADNLVAVVEPGVITGEFQAEVEKAGLFYPPDPASREFSTIGGNVAENAGGTRAVKYGVTRDYVLGLEAVLGTGEIVQTGVRTAKGVVGYDLTRLLVGSEGTLAVITRLILRLVPAPEARETVIAFYPALRDAARTVAALTSAKVVPATLEFMDRTTINCAEDYLNMGLNREAGGLLLIETDGPAAQAKAEAETAVRICEENGALSVKMAGSKKEADDLWQGRRSLSPATRQLATGKAAEDIVVPRSRIPEMVDRMDDISINRAVRIICYGHAGDGNIHVSVLYEKNDPDEVKRAHEAVHDIMAATLELEGTISGEHGIGTTKLDYISMEIRPESMDLMRRIKTAFDPKGIMNPGKIFPNG